MGKEEEEGAVVVETMLLLFMIKSEDDVFNKAKSVLLSLLGRGGEMVTIACFWYDLIPAPPMIVGRTLPPLSSITSSCTSSTTLLAVAVA